MNMTFFELLLLIIIANGAPILIRVLVRDRFDRAVDFGQKMPDGRHVFGSSKTWRGVIAALLTTGVAALVLGHPAEIGVLVALYAVAGDLASSFIKRRLAMAPSSMAPVLDQVPESLLPAVMLKQHFGLDYLAVIQLVLIFIIIELFLSHILYKWGIRKRPY